jgi:hypothetical protein
MELPVLMKYVNKVSAKSSRLTRKTARSTHRFTEMFTAYEAKLVSILKKSDSTSNVNLFRYVDARRLQAHSIHTQPSNLNSNYISYLDTTSGVLTVLGSIGGLSLDSTGFSSLRMAVDKSTILQQQLDKSTALLNHYKESSEHFSQLVKNNQIRKSTIRIRKSIDQYNQQLNSYVQLLANRKKIEEKVVRAVTHTKQFKRFMSRNSVLASMFRLPSEEEGQDSVVMGGLQTKYTVEAAIKNRLGERENTSKENIGRVFERGRSEFGDAKARLLFIGSGNEENGMPGPSQQGGQRSSAGRRIVSDINFQVHRTTVITTDIGLGIGYKLNDRSILGLGAAYKVGLGKSIQQLSFSHQGISFRSFVDWKVNNGLFISGGYERHYLGDFKKIGLLLDRDAWQHSGLMGVTKTIQYSSGMLKRTKLQLLWDFLSYQQTPRAQPLVFRMGYNF